MRMRCSNLKADLFQLHVVDDPLCACSNQIETCDHFFFHCNLYMVQRVKFLIDLKAVCNNILIDTDLLLFGSETLSDDINREIFSLVELFILESGRFVP